MNAFRSSLSVEARALARLEPFIEENADGGRYVRTDKGRLSKFLQECIGDYLMNRQDALVSIEIKAEQRHTGNLFLETWSNRNLDDPVSHALRGSNPGWLTKLQADLLFYYFLDTDLLYVLSVIGLKRWAFGMGALYAVDQRGEPRYPEVLQARYRQMNDTWGRLVPIAHLLRSMKPPPKMFTVRQLEMFRATP